MMALDQKIGEFKPGKTKTGTYAKATYLSVGSLIMPFRLPSKAAVHALSLPSFPHTLSAFHGFHV